MVDAPPASGSTSLRDVRATEVALRESSSSDCIDAIEALFQTCPDEVPSTPIKLAPSSLPSDLPGGALLRIGPNPRPEAVGAGVKAFFDGDGMIHAVTIPPPESRDDDRLYYSRAWVRAKGFSKEEEKGECLFEGTLVAPRGWPMLGAMLNNAVKAGQPVKDTANTAISTHGGRILARMEQCCPSEVTVSRRADIATVQSATSLGGTIPYDPVTGGSLGAHSKEDPDTGESMCFTYNTYPPGVRYDVRSPDGSLAHTADIALPRPIMLHDLAITTRYSVLLDLPLTLKPEKAIFDSFPVSYEEGLPGRIGLVPRRGDGEGTLWFDVEGCVVLHTINAFERSDGTVVVRGLRYMPSGPHSFLCEYSPAFPYEWVLDPSSLKCVREGYLSDVPGEFPCVHPSFVGRPSRFTFCLSPTAVGGPVTTYTAPRDSTLYGRVVKYDLEGGAVADSYNLPEGEYVVSETTCVPKLKAPGAPAAEEDCYVVFLTSKTQGDRRVPDGSTLTVLDAADLGKGPVASVPLPADVPYGLHSAFVPWEQLGE